MMAKFKRVKGGPLTLEDLEEFYTTRQGLQVALKRLVDLGELEIVGEANMNRRNPALAFALPGTVVRRNQLVHEVLGSRVIDKAGLDAVRAPHTDPNRKQDIQWAMLDGEICSGSMSYREIFTDRFPKYEDSDSIVVWFCAGLWGTHEQTRLEVLRAGADKIAEVSWFVTISEFLEKGHKAVLTNPLKEELTFAELLKEVANPEAIANANQTLTDSPNGEPIENSGLSATPDAIGEYRV